MKFKVLGLVLVLFSLSSFGQTKNQLIEYGKLSFAERDFYGASLYFGEALGYDTTNVDILWRYCEALRHYNDYKRAAKYYSYLLDLDAGTSYPEALFWLASMQKSNEEYLEAKLTFQKFIEIYTDESSYFFKKARQEVKSCEFAIEWSKSQKNVVIKNAGEGINSPEADFASVFADDSVMVFSSFRPVDNKKNDESQKYRVKLFKAAIKNGAWAYNSGFSEMLNKTGYHVANGAFGLDKRYFYFSVCDSNYHCKIYFSKKTPSGWMPPRPLDDNINLPGFTSTQPSIARVQGKEVLLFVSDRPEGYGKMDIWYVVKEQLGEFSDPINPGPAINTIDHDISPWYDSDSSYLYFSSEWHYGLGGFDVFKSKGDLKNQNNPLNLGSPVNSAANDFYFSLNESRTTGMLSSNRAGSFFEKSETCCNDIWMVQFAEPDNEKDSVNFLEDVVAGVDTLNSVLPVAIYFPNDEPDSGSRDTVTNQSYKAIYNLYTGLKNKYMDEYLSGKVDTSHPEELKLQEFFDNYLVNGYRELNLFLDRLLNSLENGKKLVVGVKGFSSPLASSEYNLNLSKRRIASFINYIKEYRSGVFLPYIEDSVFNSLQFEPVFLGEKVSDSSVSDSYKEVNRSVYSPEASLERRVEILYVRPQTGEYVYSNALFPKDTFDFGKIRSGEFVKGKFFFRNTGNTSIRIKNVSTSCGCTASSYTKGSIQPGEEGEIYFTFDSGGKYGKQVKKIIVETTGIKKLTELYVTGVVLP